MSGVNVQVVPGELVNYDDATAWSIDHDSSVLSIFKGGKIIANYNAMAWLGVWLDE